MTISSSTQRLWKASKAFCRLAAVLLPAFYLTGISLMAGNPPAPKLEHVPDLDGPGLAALLSSMEPIENNEMRGTFIISNKTKHLRSEVPFVGKVIRHGTNWDSVFEAAATAKTPAETLVVVHTPDAPNRYFYGRAPSLTNSTVNPQPISRDKAASTAFAGSDYSLADLGLDFLHWPLQERQGGQTRLSRSCFVLQSRDDRSPGIVRVRSFIDEEYATTIGSQGFPAILVAEAYDLQNEEVKEFSLHRSSFKKVNGQYKLEQMEIDNLKTGSQTTMKFD